MYYFNSGLEEQRNWFGEVFLNFYLKDHNSYDGADGSALVKH